MSSSLYRCRRNCDRVCPRSWAMVDYLTLRHGSEQIDELLHTSRRGAGLRSNGALQRWTARSSRCVAPGTGASFSCAVAGTTDARLRSCCRRTTGFSVRWRAKPALSMVLLDRCPGPGPGAFQERVAAVCPLAGGRADALASSTDCCGGDPAPKPLGLESAVDLEPCFSIRRA